MAGQDYLLLLLLLQLVLLLLLQLLLLGYTRCTHRCSLPDGRLHKSLQFSSPVRGHLWSGYSPGGKPGPGSNSLSNSFPTRAVDLPNQGTGWVVTSKRDLPVFVPQSSDYLLLHGERVNSGDWRQQRHHLVGLCHLINIGQKRNKGFRYEQLRFIQPQLEPSDKIIKCETMQTLPHL